MTSHDDEAGPADILAELAAQAAREFQSVRYQIIVTAKDGWPYIREGTASPALVRAIACLPLSNEAG